MKPTYKLQIQSHSLLGIIECEKDYLDTFGGVLNSGVERTDREVFTIDPDATSQDKTPPPGLECASSDGQSKLNRFTEMSCPSVLHVAKDRASFHTPANCSNLYCPTRNRAFVFLAQSPHFLEWLVGYSQYTRSGKCTTSLAYLRQGYSRIGAPGITSERLADTR